MSDNNKESCGSGCGCHSQESDPSKGGDGLVNRRNVLKAAGATLGVAAFAKAMAPITEWKESTSVDEFLQTHYRELTKDQLDEVIVRLEKEAKKDYGADVNITDIKPQKGVKFGYALNLSICVGCRRCAKACHEENNHDRATQRSGGCAVRTCRRMRRGVRVRRVAC